MALTDNAWYISANTGVAVYDLGSNSNSAGATLTLSNITVPAGSLIVIIASEVTSASAGSFADGGTNTYSTASSGAMSGAAGFGTIFYVANCGALTNATLTYTKQTSGRASSIAAFYATGIATSTPLDGAVTATSAVNSATPTVTAAGAPAVDGELILGACAYSNAAAKTLTNTGSFVVPFANVTAQSTASSGGGHLNVCGSLIPAAYNPTLSGASDNITFILGFKPASGPSVGWHGVTKWAASASKVCGNLVRQNVTPNIGAERVFVCVASTSGTGQTAASEPAWTTTAQCTRGVKFTDNTVTWQEATGIAALNGDLTNTPNWTTIKNTAITLGQVIQNNAGSLVLICTTAGTAGNGAEPSWAAFTNAGATTADNTATWTTLGASFSVLAAPHARHGNAYTANWGQAGNKYFLADNHVEIQPTTLNLTSPGTAASPTTSYCFDHTVGSTPPGSSNLLTTASITCSGVGTALNLTARAYYYGIKFNSFASAGTGLTIANSSAGDVVLDSCQLNLTNSVTGGAATIAIGGGTGFAYVKLHSTSFSFAVAGQGIKITNLALLWDATTSAISGTLPTTLFLASSNIGSNVIIRGVDLSGYSSGTIIGAIVGPLNYLLEGCKLAGGITVAATPTDQGAVRTDLIRCDSAATNYRTERYWYQGTQTVETTIVRTGGASDGTTTISWKIVSTANSKWVLPFESMPITVWNDSTSAITTLTFYGTTTGGGVPNNDDIWVEVEYLGDGSTPQGSFITSTKTNNLAASATTNNSSDASTWGGGGAGNGFKIVVPSFTPAQAGPINIIIKVAKATSTYYIDPVPYITGAAVQKSYISAPGVYTNERFAGIPRSRLQLGH